MTPEATHAAIVKLVDRHGYTYLKLADRVVVQDPVHQSAPGGRLVVSHHVSVTLRTYLEALKFVNERN